MWSGRRSARNERSRRRRVSARRTRICGRHRRRHGKNRLPRERNRWSASRAVKGKMPDSNGPVTGRHRGRATGRHRARETGRIKADAAGMPETAGWIAETTGAGIVEEIADTGRAGIVRRRDGGTVRRSGHGRTIALTVGKGVLTKGRIRREAEVFRKAGSRRRLAGHHRRVQGRQRRRGRRVGGRGRTRTWAHCRRGICRRGRL